jgi:3-deoxy-7-phosphoheptulonate synthase
MLLRLKKHSSAAEVESLARLARELGYEPRELESSRQLLELVPAAHAGGPGDRARLEGHAAVAQVLDAEEAPELAERRNDQPDTLVEVGSARFGRGWASLIAGPCAVDDPARLLETAHAVAAAGATLLRGGAFKPRSSPHSFQGLGRAGLEHLAAARRASGLGIVTEVLDPRDVDVVAAVADVLQVGSRNMHNGALLAEVAKAGRPVLLKRGMAATARELLQAAEYLLAGGARDVLLCERGVRGFDRATRNVLDVGAVAWLKRASHLPVIVDPSHAAGRSELVAPLARAGLAAGADGLIVEVHPAPHEARSDGAQAIRPPEFAALAEAARALLALEGRQLARLAAGAQGRAEPATSRESRAPGGRLTARRGSLAG